MSLSKSLLPILVVLFLTVGCRQTLPPPQQPGQLVPRVAVEPPPPSTDRGRVSLDVEQGPARVEVVTAREAWAGAYTAGVAERTSFLCDTPCVADLPYGSYEIKLRAVGDPTRVSTATLQVGAKPTILRHSLGTFKPAPTGKLVGGIMFTTFGGVALMMTPLFPILEADASTTIIYGGISAGVTLLGIWMLRKAKIISQDGTTVQWTPADGQVYQPL